MVHVRPLRHHPVGGQPDPRAGSGDRRGERCDDQLHRGLLGDRPCRPGDQHVTQSRRPSGTADAAGSRALEGSRTLPGSETGRALLGRRQGGAGRGKPAGRRSHRGVGRAGSGRHRRLGRPERGRTGQARDCGRPHGLEGTRAVDDPERRRHENRGRREDAHGRRFPGRHCGGEVRFEGAEGFGHQPGTHRRHGLSWGRRDGCRQQGRRNSQSARHQEE